MRIDVSATNPNSEAIALVEATGAGLPIHQQPATAYIASLRSADSRRTMTEALGSIAKMLRHDLAGLSNKAAMMATDWHRLENSHVEAICTKLAEAYSPNTANKKRAALLGVLKKSWLLGLMTREEYERAAAVQRIAGERLKRGRDVSAGEILALFNNCRNDQSIVGARDAAMLALMFGGGMRRAEVAALTLADWDSDKCQVIVQKGKGNKSREIPLPDGACRAVTAWLGRRGAALAGDPLICPLAKGDKIENRQMSTQAIWKAIQKRALKSGIASFSPHDCRRTYIGDLLEHGADLSTVQKLAGHADPKMTAHYDRRPAEVRRAAVKGLHIPFI